MIRMPMVTRKEAKEICNIRDTNEAFDGIMDALSLVATEQLERATNRFFTKQEVTEYFATQQTIDAVYDDYGSSETGTKTRVRASTIRLKGLNIESLGFEIRYDRLRLFGDDTVVDPVDYIVDQDTGAVRLLIGTYQSERGLKVTYTSGWEATEDEDINADEPVLTLSGSLPASMKEACLLQIAYLHSRRRKDNIGLTGDRSHGKADQYVQTLSWGSKQGLTREAIGLIAHLKRPLMGRY